MRSCMKLLFQTSLGEVDLNDEKGNVFTEIASVFFIIITLLMMLNVLIAGLNNNYEKIHQRSELHHYKNIFHY